MIRITKRDFLNYIFKAFQQGKNDTSEFNFIGIANGYYNEVAKK